MTLLNRNNLNLKSESSKDRYIDEVHRKIQEHLLVTDQEALDIVLSVAISTFMVGDPLWLLLVGPPGGGKTELLSAFLGSNHTFAIGKLTKNTLVSGDIKAAPDQSLLFQMNDKLVIIKDIAPLLEMSSNQQREILSDLRDAYDGLVVRSWGTGRTTKWVGKFNLMVAATEAIDKNWKLFSELGERFVRVDLLTDSMAQTEFALTRLGTEKVYRKELKHLGKEVMAHYKKLAKGISLPLSSEVTSDISRLGVLTAKLRTPVSRNGFKEVNVVPTPEVGTRLSKQLMRLAQSAAVLYESPKITHSREYRLVLRVAFDSLPKVRRRIIASLLGNQHTDAAISQTTAIPKTTVRYQLEELNLLGVLKTFSTSNTWCLNDQIVDDLMTTGLHNYLMSDV